MKPFAAVILAAGYSSRMGKFKPLLPLGSETIVEHVTSTFLNCDVATCVVTGYRGADIQAVLKDKNITIVNNQDYDKGMFSSVQAGIRALKSAYSSFFVMPVDIPLVKTSTIKILQAAAAGHPSKIIYPVFEGKRGHPPLIPVELTAPILKSGTEENLKAVLEANENLACEVAVDDKNILLNIDTIADYQKALKSFGV